MFLQFTSDPWAVSQSRESSELSYSCLLWAKELKMLSWEQTPQAREGKCADTGPLKLGLRAVHREKTHREGVKHLK